jgi:NgoFVII restriction endonuclease
MLLNNLFESVLINPATKGADELWIITGYSSPAIVHKQLDRLEQLGVNVKIHVLVGMIGLDGLDLTSHEGFKKLTKNYNGNFSCRYVLKRSITHSKNYLWLKKGKPLLGFTGSANYSVNAFSGKVIETMAEDEPAPMAKLFNKISENSIDCIDPQVAEHFSFFNLSAKTGTNYRSANAEIPELSGKAFDSTGLKSITLSLLKSRGAPAVHDSGGINWGHRDNRDRDEAYISVPTAHQGAFFPDLKKRFKVTCDDGQEFVMVAEGTNGKQVTTPDGNWQLGRYLRKRMGLKSGIKVKLEDFTRYGRSNVTFYKKSNDQFFLDFSV